MPSKGDSIGHANGTLHNAHGQATEPAPAALHDPCQLPVASGVEAVGPGWGTRGGVASIGSDLSVVTLPSSCNVSKHYSCAVREGEGNLGLLTEWELGLATAPIGYV